MSNRIEIYLEKGKIVKVLSGEILLVEVYEDGIQSDFIRCDKGNDNPDNPEGLPWSTPMYPAIAAFTIRANSPRIGVVKSGPFRCPKCQKDVTQIKGVSRVTGYMWLCLECAD
jgi:hypothetical protein